MIRYIFGAYFEQFSLSSPDVNKNKGVAKTSIFFVFCCIVFLACLLVDLGDDGNDLYSVKIPISYM